MQKLSELWRRLVFLFQRRTEFDRELEEEMRFHFEMKVEENLSLGMSPEEAHYAAKRQFGNQTLLQEVSREMWGFRALETLLQDLRYSLRVFIKQPGFTAVAIITLALGIGANSAIFSVVNAVLLRPLSFKDPDQVVKVYESLPQGGTGSVSVPNLKDWREQSDVFTGLAAYQQGNFGLQGKDEPERISGMNVSANFFDVLGVPPRLGRTFLSEEDQPGNGRVVVLSDRLWQRNFAADPNIIGKSVLLSGENFQVVGVMPPGFDYQSSAAWTTELWVPLVFTPTQLQNRGSHAFQVLGRIKPGVSLQQAQEQMSAIARRLEQQYPNQQTGRGVKVVQVGEEAVSYLRPALLILLGAVGLVLLIACTNVANLLLARAAMRRREIAIRAALGAGRGRLIRQFLTESVVLSVLGGLAGLLIAKWGISGLVALAAGYLPRAEEIGLDWRILGFTLLLSLLTGIGFGLAPALQISKTDVQDALKESGSAGATPRGNWLLRLLVVAEVAAALVLLIGAGLLIKSFLSVQRIPSGLRSENVLTMRITLPGAKYDTQGAVSFYQQTLARVASLPGVESAGIINLLPIEQYGFNGSVQIMGQPPDPTGQGPLVEYRNISPDYFRALGIPLVAGRFFNDQDRNDAQSVVIVNQAFAQRLLPNQNPIGQRILNDKPDGSDAVTIVGVVGDVKQSGLTLSVRPEVFSPYTQSAWLSAQRSVTLVVRGSSDPTALTAAIRREVQAVDPNQPIYNVQTMQTVIEKSVSGSRLNMMLLSIFAGLAMVLAIVGIYSVMSYLVTQHTREIGIRMALGAQPWAILKMVLRQGLALTLIGEVLGALGAFALTRLMANLLFGVKATDPLTYVGVSGLLLLVALLACYVPARRAMRVDPLIALRYE